jgi:catechol 2,3-dioxygenase-like lactoylglutathione lyase family enzyme
MLMLDHVSLGTHDFARAVAFYGAVLQPLGLALQRSHDDEAAFGTSADWLFFVYPLAVGEQAPGARMHVAFRAAARAEVRQAHERALAQGAQEVREPAARPQFGETYFGSVFRDTDGHVIEVMTRAA